MLAQDHKLWVWEDVPSDFNEQFEMSRFGLANKKTCDDKNLQVRFKLSATSPFGLMPLTRHRTAACIFLFKKATIYSDLCSVTHLC